jgi:hypothetical protein
VAPTVRLGTMPEQVGQAALEVAAGEQAVQVAQAELAVRVVWVAPAEQAELQVLPV